MDATDPSAPSRTRPTGAEYRRRLEVVRAQLLSGKTRALVRKLVGEEWGLQPSQACVYVRRAIHEIQEIVHRNQQDWLSEHIAIRRDIRRRAQDQMDLRMELAAADSEAKLLGLMNIKDEHGHDTGQRVQLREIRILDEDGREASDPGPDDAG